ncbi:MAG: FAD:protein FMN transferase [Gammaproteobacteria bacterium]
MGTTYTITYEIVGQASEPRRLGPQVNATLERVVAQMSTYDPGSELSRFNAQAQTDWFPVSRDLVLVIDTARTVSDATGGAFDVTIGPLVNLWRFGPHAAPAGVPRAESIASAKKLVSYQHLEADLQSSRIRKVLAGVYVDLSGIAQGFAVDKITGLLRSVGVKSYLVELGGELSAAGVNPNGVPWRVAIERPWGARPGELLDRIISLNGTSLATSGDYRKYFEHDGHIYSHIIDPRTGWPVSGDLTSVSVIHRSTMHADALATALLVMGREKGAQFSERHGLAVLFVSRNGNSLHEEMTAHFRSATVH